MGIRWPVFAIPWAISGGLRRWLRIVLSVVIETNTISLTESLVQARLRRFMSRVHQTIWLHQRAFMRRTVVACQVVERPEGVCTPQSVRILARALAGASGDILQSLVDNPSYLLTLHLILPLM